MTVQRFATSGYSCTTTAFGCGRADIDSSNTQWWRGNWWRSDRRLFRMPLP